ncbi:YidB family protein [Luteimonas sp. SX5]|uniref:YidB family protein n=1 Tax=Luteimonas galliterrae TaxID=2940486 RepID=A0ABT0MJV5_9GAMM|nr:YidB family protein [Luteimonas galliterrae]MCL1634534.1 YidB family protein [Luteimonas galliterrae]
MFDVLVSELSERYGLGDRGRDLFGLLMGYIYNDRRGGFGGFAESFRQQGHGDLFASWLGGDARRQRTLTASDVGMVFGQGLLSDWGNRIGASRATVAAAIAGVLPRLIGELTPGGRLPEAFGAGPVKATDARTAHTDAPVDADDDREAVTDAGVVLGHAASAPYSGDRIASANLRRDGVRTEPQGSAAPIDPHVAAITEAVFSDEPLLRDVEFRRPPPRRERGGFGWLLWSLIILAALAAGGWYYVQRYGLPPGVQLPWSTTPATNN